MTLPLQSIVGPRVPEEELRRRGLRYALPTIVLSVARLALLCSIFLPYWHLDLKAPQYPKGLQVTTYVNQVTGDVREVDSLNHYIGMRPLADAAKFEKSVSILALIALVLLVEGVAYVHSKWAVLIALPAVLYPGIFLADLYYWLHRFGTNLDPTAAMSSSVKPFTPPLLGKGVIGQFESHAYMGLGLQLAFLCSALVLVGLWLHRRAYKPLYEAYLGATVGQHDEAVPA
jgi:copper chaperone NosL